jgi:hypothetical protein
MYSQSSLVFSFSFSFSIQSQNLYQGCPFSYLTCLQFSNRWVAITQASRIGIYRSWESTRPNSTEDLAQRYCNIHLCSAIVTASLLTLNLQILGISTCMNGMVLNYLVPFRWGRHHPSFQCSADRVETHPTSLSLQVLG